MSTRSHRRRAKQRKGRLRTEQAKLKSSSPADTAEGVSPAQNGATLPAGTGENSIDKELGLLRDKAESFDTVLAAIDEGSGFIRGLWVSFVLLGAYLVITTASVTHIQLFLETPIKLPLLDVNLPLVAFFWVAPFIFIIFHFYILLQLVVLAEKIRRLNDVIAGANLDDAVRHNLRLLLPNDLLVQFLAGPRKRRQGAMGLMFRLVTWITVVAGPLLLLLLVQYKFLPYQNELVSWTNRFFVVLDLSLLWVLWRTVVADTDQRRSAGGRLRWSARIAGTAGSAAVVLASLVILTFPGEHLDGLWLQQRFHSIFTWQLPAAASQEQQPTARSTPFHIRDVLAAMLPHISASDADQQGWLKRTPEARRIIPGTLRLQQSSLVDLDILKKIEDRAGAVANLWEGERTGHFNERNFVAANFSKADLRRADLQNSSFANANFVGANLSGALLRNVNLNGALLDNANLNGASLDGSSLMRSSLGSTQLRQASLYNSDLRQAWMFEAVLNGAILDRASLEGATLDRSSFIGARLFQARISGASMQGASLQGAKLEGAALLGVSLRGASMDGANLASAELEAADLTGSHLNGALLDDARLQGAILEDVELANASVVGAYVFGSVGMPTLNKARVSDANTSAVFPAVWRRTAKIDQAVVSLWTDIATSQVDSAQRRTAISERISRLLNNMDDANLRNRLDTYWTMNSARDPMAYSKSLQEFLVTLACRRDYAPHVARNVLQSAATEPQGRNWAAGPYFEIFAQAILASRNDVTACPGAAGFADEDWTRLTRIVESLPRPNSTIISECACSSVGAPFIARGLLNSGMLAAAGDQLLPLATKMRAARVRLEECPGVRHFTEADWKELETMSPAPIGASVVGNR